MQKSLCYNCKHYLSNGRCFAFQDGIPKIIINGNETHVSPIEGQKNNIVFEQIKEPTK